jgi:hypothetical protein
MIARAGRERIQVLSLDQLIVDYLLKLNEVEEKDQ